MATNVIPKKKKTTQSSIKLDPRAICRTNPHLLYEPLREYKGTEEYIKQVADGMLWWAANDPDALDFSQFTFTHRIPKMTLWEWKQKSPYLKQAIELVKNKLYWNRELAIADGKLHPSTVTSTRHLYDETYNNEEDRKAVQKARAKAQEESGKMTVLIRDLVESQAIEEEEVVYDYSRDN